MIDWSGYEGEEKEEIGTVLGGLSWRTKEKTSKLLQLTSLPTSTLDPVPKAPRGQNTRKKNKKPNDYDESVKNQTFYNILTTFASKSKKSFADKDKKNFLRLPIMRKEEKLKKLDVNLQF